MLPEHSISTYAVFWKQILDKIRAGEDMSKDNKKKNRKKPVISISLLASNRKETTRKCLDSLQPIMEQIPSELIIVDTGCDEEQRQVLEEYADQIIPFTWCGDFSKARNVGLEAASGEWFLYIDDDEWFVEVREILNFFKSGNYKRFGYATYIQRNFLDLEGKHYSDSWVSRMIRLDKDTCFKSKIHEYLHPLRGECAGLHAIVHHYGYIYSNAEEKFRHFQRNSVLLKEMIEEEPDVMRWWVQLMQEYRSVNEHQDMLTLGEEGLERFKDRTLYSERIDIGTFYIGRLTAFIGMERYQEGLEECMRAFEDKRNTDLCMACICLAAGEIHYYLKHWSEAEKYTLEYLDWYKKLKDKEKQLFVEKMALLVNEAFDELRIKKAYSLLICIDLRQHKTEYLKEYLPKLQWEDSYVYLFEDMMTTLTEGMARTPYEEIFTQLVNIMNKHGGLWGQFVTRVEHWEISQREGLERLMYILSTVEGKEEYLWHARIRSAAMREESEKLPQLYQDYFDHVEHIFDMRPVLKDIAAEHGIMLEEYYLGIPMGRWMNQVRDYAVAHTFADFKKTWDELNRIKTKDDIHYLFYEMWTAELELLAEKNWNDFSHCKNLLLNYASVTLDFNKRYYRQEIFEMYRELLPLSVQTAYWLHRAFETEEKDRSYHQECLKNAIGLYPELADAVKAYIRLRGEEQIRKEQEVWKAKRELWELTRNIKVKIRELLDKNMLEEADTVLTQLKTMLPHDLEVVTLGLQIKLKKLEAGC